MVAGDTVATRGDRKFSYRLASISKMMTAWAVLVAVEEGIVDLDENVGPATLRQLLSHAGGFGFDGDAPIMPPGRRRIYSNTGIELAAAHVARRSDMTFDRYLTEAVLEPLAMDNTALHGSPAHAIWSDLDDTCRFVAELMRPTLVSRPLADEATSIQFPELGGVVPGLGSFHPNPWGLGIEIRGGKSPHWTGDSNSARKIGRAHV